jgi:hypothetical protein
VWGRGNAEWWDGRRRQGMNSKGRAHSDCIKKKKKLTILGDNEAERRVFALSHVQKRLLDREGGGTTSSSLQGVKCATIALTTDYSMGTTRPNAVCLGLERTSRSGCWMGKVVGPRVQRANTQQSRQLIVRGDKEAAR